MARTESNARGSTRALRKRSMPDEMQRVTHYTKSGDIHIAYQVFGEGRDLVVAPGFVSHIENSWDEPRFARWLNKLGGFCRVILFDKRGTGLSDRLAHLPHMDERMDDLRAVMDAVGLERASLLGISEGGSLAALSAALLRPLHSAQVMEISR